MVIKKKGDKFYIMNVEENGGRKGILELGINMHYKGNLEDISLEDLIEFVYKKGIKPSSVRLHLTFSADAKEESTTPT